MHPGKCMPENLNRAQLFSEQPLGRSLTSSDRSQTELTSTYPLAAHIDGSRTKISLWQSDPSTCSRKMMAGLGCVQASRLFTPR